MSKHRITAFGVVILLGLMGCGDRSEPTEGNGGSSPSDQSKNAAGGTPPVSVNVEAVERRRIQGWVYGQGTARSRQREFLTFTQQGVVSHVDEHLRVGMPVKAGQLIAHQAPERVTADLQAARASLAEAQANLTLANVTQQRYERLLEQRSASRQELDEAIVQVEQAKAARDSARAELAQAQLSVDESRLVSPMDGVLARLNIEKGRYFMPSTVQTDTEQNALRTVPAMVIDPRRFEVRVDIPSYDYRQLKTEARALIGENASVSAQSIDPERRDGVVEGQVYAISPSLDPETRTFQVIIHTQDEDPGLQDGEFVAVWIADQAVEDALVVPLEALRFRNDQSFVFVVDEQTNKVTERRVELGRQSGDYRAVTAGVEGGELVVTDGRAALHDGQPVRILQRGENMP
ncbi:efflux RND transporter periplasmic adaptor subunit [Stutzerimonas azotifigens]|uniref:Efflux RND transporter periplasmic adaptor subunit n=1 Tax=Stutzerimonas azotifigens TaxID=291995 RepID=A0ABR5Z5E5_9GAMM|nr:efflux RND transporter periplasmic adaptor subunit [Stutzerimonas azotifigens]MBA1275356.1 efflux RND transporter periplasmic adaptor subunit [Stutzerimonas azotifigens]